MGLVSPADASSRRRRAWALLGAVAAVLAFAALLNFAFESDVQDVSASELVARSDDARAFLIADLFFPVLYAAALPLALWRFGSSLAHGRPPRWVAAAAIALVGAGLCDLTENALLLAATSSESPDLVDTAHAFAVPKLALFALGAILALAVLARAVIELRRPSR